MWHLCQGVFDEPWDFHGWEPEIHQVLRLPVIKRCHGLASFFAKKLWRVKVLDTTSWMLWPQSFNVRLTTQLKGELKDWTLPLPWYLNDFGWKTCTRLYPQIQWLISMFPIGIAPGQVDGCQAGPGCFSRNRFSVPWNWTRRLAFGTASYFVKKTIWAIWVSGRFSQRNPVWNHQMFGPSDFSWEEAVETPLMGTTWTTSCRLALELDSCLTRLSWYSNPPKKIENMVNSIGNQNHDLWWSMGFWCFSRYYRFYRRPIH